MNLAVPLKPVVVNGTQAASPMSAEALLGEGRRNGAEAEMDKVKPVVDAEQPWHKHLARYLAMGMSQVDAAKACDCSPNHVSRLLRTPWFQARVNEFLMAESVDVMSLFKSSFLGAYATLVDICNNPLARPSDRIASAKELLDRYLGKSMQHLKVEPTSSSEDPVTEVERLEAELKRIS